MTPLPVRSGLVPEGGALGFVIVPSTSRIHQPSVVSMYARDSMTFRLPVRPTMVKRVTLTTRRMRGSPVSVVFYSSMVYWRA